jgi:hypothetical protein
MNLSFEEFKKAKAAGYSSEDITRLASFDAPKKAVTTQAPKANVQSEIAARGNVWENIKNDFMSPNPVRKTMGALGAIGSPLTAIENTVANPALEMQRGNFNPMDLAKEAYQGMTGQKQGQYGDVYREAGVPKPLAATAGLILNASPIKMANMASKALGGITKMSDKGILKAGKALESASDQAMGFVGKELDSAFAQVDSMFVDPKMAQRVVAGLPKEIKTVLTENFGNLGDFAKKMTIGQLRQFKQVLGKYSPSSFGREERGLLENIAGDKVNKAYASAKQLLEDALRTNKSTKGEFADKLLGLEDRFSQVAKASSLVKKTITEPTLQMVTEAGKMAGKIQAEGKVGGRVALNILRGAGKEARKSINKAVSELDAFNKWRAVSEVGRKAVNALAYGGIAGSLGGLALGKVVRPNSD